MAILTERNIVLVSKDSNGNTCLDYPLTKAEQVEDLESYVKNHSTQLKLPLSIANGGTGQTTIEGIRNTLGLGNTTGALPIANGGTGQTTIEGIRHILGLSNATGALPIANGGTGAATAHDARSNLGVDIDVLLADATLLWQNPKPTSSYGEDFLELSQPYTNFKRLLFITSSAVSGFTFVSASFINVDVLSANIELARKNEWTYVVYTVGQGGSGIYGDVSMITTTKLQYSVRSGLRPQFVYGYK